MSTETVVCGACQKQFDRGQQYAYLGPHYYCSKECYHTLFDHCDTCGVLNMTVVWNFKEHGDKECDKCRDARLGLTSVTLHFSSYY